jgi:5-methyltetrahydrofolate--homocysteine methyltransferase
MTTQQERLAALTDILEQRVLVLDGAMGTMLQQRELKAEDFGGAALEGCNENLVRTRPYILGMGRRHPRFGQPD